MPGISSSLELYPELSRTSLNRFRTSFWYPRFQAVTIKATVIPLDEEFRRYMHADSVTIPEGADDHPAVSTLSDDEDQDDSDDSDPEPATRFAFPELDQRIREVIKAYDGGVFPKLNWSAPKDARWIAPSPPLRCLTPADVYLLLKSSDFISHDVDPSQAYDGCLGEDSAGLPLELVLKKYYPIQESREVRCFVRRSVLIAISQRDPNYYEFWNDSATQENIRQAVIRFFDQHIQQCWEGPPDYVVDLLLTRDLARAHIVDFNPYAPRTDSLLFTYPELLALAESNPPDLPVLRAIDSRTHDSAVRNAPQYQHNMVPLDMLQAATGQDIESFAQTWDAEIRRAMED
ncbi:D123-domain-containing protein [Auricularia subglabra TFB-10046 SS5]|nr:D123-domain-containing protein [Auricularia subglabra TFB-10046 SS5]